MSPRQAMDWARHHRCWVALIIVIFFGYSVGKDLALRDNKTDAAQTAGVR